LESHTGNVGATVGNVDGSPVVGSSVGSAVGLSVFPAPSTNIVVDVVVSDDAVVVYPERQQSGEFCPSAELQMESSESQ